jgi:hypothetical protein
MIEGGCRCGAVRYRLDALPLMVRQCWCRDCQHISGGNATVNLIVRRDSLHVTGSPAHFESLAESGNHMSRYFCGTCGSPLFSESLENPDFRGVRVGSLDQPGRFPPQAIIWTDSAPAWAHVDPALPAFPRQVPLPALPGDKK